MPLLVGGFKFQPIWKILVKLDHFPKWMKIKNVWNHHQRIQQFVGWHTTPKPPTAHSAANRLFHRFFVVRNNPRSWGFSRCPHQSKTWGKVKFGVKTSINTWTALKPINCCSLWPIDQNQSRYLFKRNSSIPKCKDFRRFGRLGWVLSFKKRTDWQKWCLVSSISWHIPNLHHSESWKKMLPLITWDPYYHAVAYQNERNEIF